MRRVDLVHRGGPRVGSGLGAQGTAQRVGVVRMRVRVCVVRVRVVPGLGCALVQVAVQRGRRVGVRGGEGQLGVRGGQGAAQRRGHWRLVRAVPEGGGEAALAHREGAIFRPACPRGGKEEKSVSPSGDAPRSRTEPPVRLGVRGLGIGIA